MKREQMKEDLDFRCACLKARSLEKAHLKARSSGKSQWWIQCANSQCRQSYGGESDAAVIEPGMHEAMRDQMYAEAAASGWIIAANNDMALASSERIAFCSEACKARYSHYKRLHRPIDYLDWVSVYKLDFDDLQGSLDRSDLGGSHRKVAQRIVDWLMQNEVETRNANVEWARWKLAAVWRVDSDIAPDDPVVAEKAGTNHTMDFLLWRVERRETLLFLLEDNKGDQHGVWHWVGYGMICPSIWLTKGSGDLLAKWVSKAVNEGWLKVAGDEKWRDKARDATELAEAFEDLVMEAK